MYKDLIFTILDYESPFVFQDELTIGKSPKSIQCYMHETGGSEGDTRKHINKLIRENWKRMNEDFILNNSPFNQIFVRATMNLVGIYVTSNVPTRKWSWHDRH